MFCIASPDYQEQRVHPVRSDRQVHHPNGRISSLRRGEQRLLDDQRLLHWNEEARDHPEEIPLGALQALCPGADQPKVYRHLIQDGTRSLPVVGRQVRIHGSTEEGPNPRGKGTRRCCGHAPDVPSCRCPRSCHCGSSQSVKNSKTKWETFRRNKVRIKMKFKENLMKYTRMRISFWLEHLYD